MTLMALAGGHGTPTRDKGIIRVSKSLYRDGVHICKQMTNVPSLIIAAMERAGANTNLNQAGIIESGMYVSNKLIVPESNSP